MPTKTKNQSVSAGDIWAIPVSEVGYFLLIVASVTDPKSKAPFVFAYVQAHPSKSIPSPNAIPKLADWKEAWIGLVPLRPFENGRWKRVGSLPNFEKADWPVAPGSRTRFSQETLKEFPKFVATNLCSIETTRDEPTMTALDCTGVSPEVAAEFPEITTLTKASSFETALANHSRQRDGGFWDLQLKITPVSAASISRWNTWAADARKRCADRIDPPIPPGRTTDRRVKPGDWLGFPLVGGGFGAALVARRKAGAVIFGDAIMYTFPRCFDYFPTLDQLRELRPEDACLLVGTSLIVVRDGRWRVLGEHPNFDPKDWIIPHPWHQTTDNRGTGKVSAPNRNDKWVDIVVPESILKLDPYSSDFTSCMSPAALVESDTSAFAHGVEPAPDLPKMGDLVVTPKRLMAWRKQLEAIESQLA